MTHQPYLHKPDELLQVAQSETLYHLDMGTLTMNGVEFKPVVSEAKGPHFVPVDVPSLPFDSLPEVPPGECEVRQ